MNRLIVYVDDATHAWGVLQALRNTPDASAPRQWILVACAPRVTQHVSKWVTHRARESWRGKWTDKLFAQLIPQIEGEGHEVLACVAKNNLALQTEDLIRAHGPAQVIDARRPKQSVAPWAPGAANPKPSGLLGLWLGLAGSGLCLAE